MDFLLIEIVKELIKMYSSIILLLIVKVRIVLKLLLKVNILVLLLLILIKQENFKLRMLLV